jgi:hypothetical protein
MYNHLVLLRYMYSLLGEAAEVLAIANRVAAGDMLRVYIRYLQELVLR